jgi:2,4-dienoyl-CoA reductase-like NADH-dependent reductase (Old Yellow Enzyme family)
VTEHAKFHYQSLPELQAEAARLQLDLPFSQDVSILSKPFILNGKTVPNRMIIHPMEGCDGTADGKPDELTFRRYRRFAAGGAGLLWFEATAVVHEGRANPRQITICQATKDSFAALLADSLTAGREANGVSWKPYTVLQLTHSGRYSRPADRPEPIIAQRSLALDPKLSIEPRVITDEELEALEDKYVEAAVIAADIGFDAVDVKSCHGYLIDELLGSHTRPGKYGGSFENRTRFLVNIVDKIRRRLGDSLAITLRLNAYDSIPYPCGWGVDKADFHKPDMSEPIRLLTLLRVKGVRMVNLSAGNPYFNPHIGRPYDIGSYLPPFHPLENAAVLLNVAREAQVAVPEMAIIGTGFSWFRQFAPHVAAAAIEQGWFQLAGFGRQAFAYPSFAHDITATGAMDPKKVCIACSKCTVIMRDSGRTGCVIRDAQVYGPIYREGREGKATAESIHVAEHV